MARVLQVLGWLLIVAATLLFVGALCLLLCIPQVSAPALIGAAVVPAGLLLTLGGLLLTKSREAIDARRKTLSFLPRIMPHGLRGGKKSLARRE
jgi:hypothetical protein